MTRITGARTLDIRAPTSRTLAGSDAVHQDPDYSGAYVFLATDGPHEGVGMTFTIGRGNDLCCAAIDHLATAAIVNAVWDLWARVEQKPLWQLVCDLSPEQFVASVDFRYLTDVLDR